MKKHTVITGASSGLGRVFAIAFAKRGHHLVLVALPNENLSEFTVDLHKAYGVNVEYYEADLSDFSMIKDFANWLKNNEISINVLVNNAGVGGSKSFQDSDTEQLDRIIQVNVKGTAILTRSLLPFLLQNTNSYILNVASIAAFSPLPYKMVYPATKAFIYSFSLSLGSELREKGVKVCVVNPGAMPTNEDIRRRIKTQGWLGRISITSTEYVAEKAIEGAFSGKTIVVPGLVNWFNYWIFKLVPWYFIEPLVSRTIRRELVVSAS
ncbi:MULTISPECIES: SDR family oxidoreductase [Emticicia]|uniref:SDR family NAD(P)-dependent oxidoreductase n=1 Tax=Emticicia TaxID=312278 RepID=UPI0007D8C607|nr:MULTISPECIES: SDR family oxidoreductase [Emticicia]